MICIFIHAYYFPIITSSTNQWGNISCSIKLLKYELEILSKSYLSVGLLHYHLNVFTKLMVNQVIRCFATSVRLLFFILHNLHQNMPCLHSCFCDFAHRKKQKQPLLDLEFQAKIKLNNLPCNCCMQWVRFTKKFRMLSLIKIGEKQALNSHLWFSLLLSCNSVIYQ